MDKVAGWPSGLRHQVTDLKVTAMQVRNQLELVEVFRYFVGFARTLMLNISFLQNFAKWGPRLSYKAVLSGVETPSPIQVLLCA